MIRTYERMVSLGNFCLTKYQINRHVCRKYFALEPNSTNLASQYVKMIPKFAIEKINGSNAVFDWTVIQNYENLCRLISGGLNYQLETTNLVEVLNADGSREGIRDEAAGILWVHLFKAGEGATNWKDQVPQLTGKVQHLIRNFLACKAFSTAYIATFSDVAARSELPRSLASALKNVRGNDKEMSLIIAVPNGQNLPQDSDGIFFRSFSDKPETPEYPWLGNAESWDEIFSEFTFSHSQFSAVKFLGPTQAPIIE